MGNMRFIRNKGFTLVETIVVLSLFAIIAGASYWLIDYSVQTHRLASERARIEQRLHAITNTVSDDSVCIVLKDKGFCNLEIQNTPNDMKLAFFTSNNDEHVTQAVSLVLQRKTKHLQSLTKHELSSADSLFLQNTLNNEKNLSEIFAKYTPQKTTVLGSNLFDFRVRLAIRTTSGGIFFTPPNASVTYKREILTYRTKDGLTAHVRGDLFFVDITARALPNSCMAEFQEQSNDGYHALDDDLTSKMCKSFRRIAIKGRYF